MANGELYIRGGELVTRQITSCSSQQYDVWRRQSAEDCVFVFPECVPN